MSSLLKKGSTGSAVKTMQKMLIACGYSCGSYGADGDFGKATLAALKAFQKAAGLDVDGIYGPASKAALEKAYKGLSGTTSTTDGTATDDEKAIWNRLYAAIQNPYGVAGVMGNFKAESALCSNNLQNSYEKKLGMTDEQYTAAVDNGSYTNFVHDSAGYGLAQWTYYSLKEGLLKYAQSVGKSIGDRDMQVDFFLKQMKEGYPAIWKVLTTAKTVREASDAVLLKFERSADQSEAVQVKRAGYGEAYLNKYGSQTATQPTEQPATPTVEEKVQPTAQTQDSVLTATHSKYINSTGTHYISNSGKDENNAYKGGKAGDQSGHEWELKAWYNRPWSVVLRYPDQAVALKIAQLSIDAALNDKIGYDQGQRTTYWAQLKAVGFEPSKITVACEEDCTAGVSANVMAAGHIFGIKALQDVGSCSSRNMKAQFTKAGFKALTDSKYLTGTKYLLPGDILLYESHHAAANVTLGAKVKDEWKPTASSAPATSVTTPASAVPTATTYYRVRKSWTDKSSQIGAFTVFQNAKNCVDANSGYAAFDDNGNQVYPVAEKSFSPYRVKVSIPDLNYRIGPATTYTSYGYIEPGVYTIVGEENGWGLLEEFASLRNGWICLDYAKKV